jgi:predicted RNase H-like HicB family nuclease
MLHSPHPDGGNTHSETGQEALKKAREAILKEIGITL